MRQYVPSQSVFCVCAGELKSWSELFMCSTRAASENFTTDTQHVRRAPQARVKSPAYTRPPSVSCVYVTARLPLTLHGRSQRAHVASAFLASSLHPHLICIVPCSHLIPNVTCTPSPYPMRHRRLPLDRARPARRAADADGEHPDVAGSGARAALRPTSLPPHRHRPAQGCERHDGGAPCWGTRAS